MSTARTANDIEVVTTTAQGEGGRGESPEPLSAGVANQQRPDNVAATAGDESLSNKVARLEATLRAIASCTLTGVDFGDWVQSVCEDALEGLFPECWNCGTFVHNGPCVSEEGGGQ